MWNSTCIACQRLLDAIKYKYKLDKCNKYANIFRSDLCLEYTYAYKHNLTDIF
jgi:hypothetical protein